jgi:hypothetical protein
VPSPAAIQGVGDEVEAVRELPVDVVAGNGRVLCQPFLLATTVHVVLPALMVIGTLVLRPQANRIVNIALAVVHAASIVGGAIGEWNYYVLGSVIEVVLLAAIGYCAWTWPKREGTPWSR